MATKTPTLLAGLDLYRLLPPTWIPLLKRLGELADMCDETAYLVGGPVRDLLLNRLHADLDIVIEGDGIAFAEDAAPALGGKVVKTHPDFGTATLELPRHGKVDIATARSEIYARPAALPEVRPATLYDDLQRRDFSMNALAMSLRPERGGRSRKWLAGFGEIVDFFGGIGDIRTNRIRILHPFSFVDDPTRLFRAVRFERRFRFRWDDETREAFSACVRDGWIRELTGARIRNEILLLLKERHPAELLKRLAELGIFEALGIGLRFDARIEQRLEDTSRLPFPNREDGLLLVWLGGHVAGTANAVADAWMLGKETTTALNGLFERREEVSAALKSVGAGLKPAPPSRWYRLLHDLPAQTVYALCAEVGADAQATLLERWEQAKEARPFVTGDDLKAMGFAPGPLFRQVLDATFEAQLDGKLTNFESAREFVRARWEQSVGDMEEN